MERENKKLTEKIQKLEKNIQDHEEKYLNL